MGYTYSYSYAVGEVRSQILQRFGASAAQHPVLSGVKRIVSPYAEAALLLGAGVLAGTVGSAGGITSLISFPALLAVGLAPLPANVTQAVAVVASWPGSALGSRWELRGKASFLRRWALLIAVGAATGVALLLCAPAQVFEYVVPYLLVVRRALCSSSRG